MSTQLKHAIDVKQSNCNKCVNVPATYNIWLMENLVVVAYHLLLDATGMGETRVTKYHFWETTTASFKSAVGILSRGSIFNCA